MGLLSPSFASTSAPPVTFSPPVSTAFGTEKDSEKESEGHGSEPSLYVASDYEYDLSTSSVPITNSTSAPDRTTLSASSPSPGHLQLSSAATQEQDVLASDNYISLQILAKTGPLPKSQYDSLVKRLLAEKNYKETLVPHEVPEGILDVAEAWCKDGLDGKLSSVKLVDEMSTTLNAIEDSTNTESASSLAIIPVKNITSEITNISKYPVAGGGYCDLYSGEKLGGQKVALKLVRLFGQVEKDRDTAKRLFLSEMQIWGNLHHPKILEFYGVCEHEPGTLSLYMVSPFQQNGNIMHYLNKINLNVLTDINCS